MAIHNGNICNIVCVAVAALQFVSSLKRLKLPVRKLNGLFHRRRIIIGNTIPEVPVESEHLGYFSSAAFSEFKRELVFIIMKFQRGGLPERNFLFIPKLSEDKVTVLQHDLQEDHFIVCKLVLPHKGFQLCY